MSVLDQLSSALGGKDEIPNQELARKIMETNDRVAISELIQNLDNKASSIRHDCIKVLYEAGALKPSLISGHVSTFVALLTNKDNRMQWGAMTALAAIARESPELVYPFLSKVIHASENGSVITKDRAAEILISLCGVNQYADHAFKLLMAHLKSSPVNQLPMYAEKAMAVITASNKATFVGALTTRLDEIDAESKRKRVEKVIKKLA